MKKLLVIIFAVSFICGVSAMACDGAKSSQAAANCPFMQKTANATMASAKDGEKVVLLNVSNMTCNGCVTHVTKALAAVDGVSDVKVNLEKGTAEVKYATAKVQPEMLTAAVVKAGYPAQFADVKVTTGDAKGCDPAACAKMDKAACAKMAADGKCDPAACKAKMASTTAGAKGAACDYKKGTCTAPDKEADKDNADKDKKND